MLTTKNWDARQLSVIAASAVVLLGGCMQPGPRALLDGDRFIREQKYAQAIEKLKVAVQLLPQNPQAWNRLGLALHGAGQPAEAAKAYRQALQVDPNLAVARYNLGCLLLEQNHLAPALSELASYTVLARNSPEGWLKLGEAQWRSQQIDAADKSYRTALQLNPALPEAWNAVGMIQMQRLRPREAVQHFHAALQHQPRYAPALLNLAIVNHQNLTNRAAAAQCYRDYLKLEPRSSLAPAISDILQQLDWELTPRQEIATLTNRPPLSNGSPARVTFQTGSLQSNLPPIASAAQPAKINGASLPTHPESPPNAGKIEGMPPEISRASSNSVSPLLTQNAESVKPPVITADDTASKAVSTPKEQGLIEERVPDPAVITPGRVPIVEPEATSSAVATAKSNAASPATLFAPRKLAEKPSLMERLNPAGWLRSREKADRKEAPELKEEENIQLSRPAPQTNASVIAAARPAPPVRTEPVTPVFARYRYLSPAKPAAGDRSKAEPHFARALKAHQERRTGDAILGYRQATLFDPSFFEAYYNLGLAALEARDLPLALSACERALSINATSADARYHLALALQQANYPLDAVNELQKVLETRSEDARAHFALAKLYADTLVRSDLAREHYLRTLQLDPRHPQAMAIRYWLAAHP